MTSLFDKSVESIQEFYTEKGYNLGWRFLNCSKATLKKIQI